jgi:hypothetical protein
MVRGGLSVRGWAAGVVIVALAWAAGLLLWGPPETLSEFRPINVWHWVITIGVVGMPLMVLSAVLQLARTSRIRRVGSVLVVLGILWLAYSVSFVHLGDICLDPGDSCVVTWLPRITGMVAGLAPVVVAWVIVTLGRSTTKEGATSTVAV